jgi:hypothetical protein
MANWNCAVCGLYLENKRNLIEFPLGGTVVFCKNCAGQIHSKTIKCRGCGKRVVIDKSWHVRFCNERCSDAYYKKKAAGAFD